MQGRRHGMGRQWDSPHERSQGMSRELHNQLERMNRRMERADGLRAERDWGADAVA
eukprot:CAMPEP_0179444106 /NCGR_PEP_ID=MMETSP0799-20121207/27587_1 /TAXON_ID=46947 /ORGANISM="Geminigera cryophila, Strain CCMP2564" /LENGTH=55 /DNA_ID=CAMNT_0021230887 /DNA_START=357 /DNA_END=524 /DNA_ORIENTATION=+